jgi:hypothetical protein
VVAVLAGKRQEPGPALFASVSVTVCAEAVAVAEQDANWLPSVTPGAVGTPKDELKTVVMVEPPTRAPVAVEVKPTVQLESAAAVCGEPAKLTAVGAAAAAIVAVALTAVVSFDVFTEIVLLPVEVVFVIPSSFTEVAELFPRAQVWPLAFASVIVTVAVAVAAVAVQLVAKPLGASKTTTGFAGIVPPVQVGKVTVIVPPAARAPVELDVKFAVQLA